MEKGTNQAKIVQFICFLKTAILDIELEKVPKVKENGTKELGRKRFNIGISIKLAPPPQIVLIQNATILPKNNTSN